MTEQSLQTIDNKITDLMANSLVLTPSDRSDPLLVCQSVLYLDDHFLFTSGLRTDFFFRYLQKQSQLTKQQGRYNCLTDGQLTSQTKQLIVNFGVFSHVLLIFGTDLMHPPRLSVFFFVL